jgi:hypothetical protein
MYAYVSMHACLLLVYIIYTYNVLREVRCKLPHTYIYVLYTHIYIYIHTHTHTHTHAHILSLSIHTHTLPGGRFALILAISSCIFVRGSPRVSGMSAQAHGARPSFGLHRGGWYLRFMWVWERSEIFEIYISRYSSKETGAPKCASIWRVLAYRAICVYRIWRVCVCVCV